MGVAGQVLGKQADFFDHLFNLGNALFFAVEELKVVKAFGNDVVDSCTLIQGRGGILENHLDISDDFPVQAAAGLSGNADTLVLDLTGCTGIYANDGAANGSLTGTGLTNQRESLALIDIEAGILNCTDCIVTLAEGDIHILKAQQDLAAVFVQRTMFGQMSCLIIFCHCEILLP